MAYSLTFSALNEKLRPRITTSDKLYSSLNRMEERQTTSLRCLPSSYRPTVLPTNTKLEVPETTTEPGDPEEPEENAEQEDLVSDDLEEGHCPESLPFDTSCLTELSIKEVVDEDSGNSLSEEKDIPGELTTTGTAASSQSAVSEGESSFQRSYLDMTLPDLIRSGRPLGRRRTLGHVSDTVREQNLLGQEEHL